MAGQNKQRRASVQPGDASLMTNADLDKSIAVLQSVQEERRQADEKKTRGRPRKEPLVLPQRTYAAAIASGTTACAKSSGTVGKRQKEKTLSTAELGVLVCSLQSKLAASEKRIEALERALRSAPTPTPRQQHQVVNLAARDSAERDRRATNVIIRGLPPLADTEDTDLVNAFLKSVCKETALEVKAVRRLRTKASSKTNTTRTDQPVCPILVTLTETSQRDLVVRSAPRRSAVNNGGAFAHQDRTPAQQQQFQDCLKEATEKNNVLARHSLLKKPFLWVVRGDRVRCTDRDESTLAQKSIYVTDTTVYAAIRNAKQQQLGSSNSNFNEKGEDSPDALALAAAAAKGHVNARRH